jgi:hypothetical protein
MSEKLTAKRAPFGQNEAEFGIPASFIELEPAAPAEIAVGTVNAPPAIKIPRREIGSAVDVGSASSTAMSSRPEWAWLSMTVLAEAIADLSRRRRDELRLASQA